MIVIRSFIEGLPEGILESARIDGAGEFTTFVRVVLPLTVRDGDRVVVCSGRAMEFLV